MKKYEKISVNVNKELITKIDKISDFMWLNRSAIVIMALDKFVKDFEKKMNKLNKEGK